MLNYTNMPIKSTTYTNITTNSSGIDFKKLLFQVGPGGVGAGRGLDSGGDKVTPPFPSEKFKKTPKFKINVVTVLPPSLEVGEATKRNARRTPLPEMDINIVEEQFTSKFLKKSDIENHLESKKAADEEFVRLVNSSPACDCYGSPGQVLHEAALKINGEDV